MLGLLARNSPTTSPCSHGNTHAKAAPELTFGYPHNPQNLHLSSSNKTNKGIASCQTKATTVRFSITNSSREHILSLFTPMPPEGRASPEPRTTPFFLDTVKDKRSFFSFAGVDIGDERKPDAHTNVTVASKADELI